MPIAVGTVRDIPVRALKLCGLTWFGRQVWYSEAVSNQIIAMDIAGAQVESRIACPEVRTDLTSLGGNLLQVVGAQRNVRVLDPESGETLGELPNPRPGHALCGLEATRHGIWMGYEDLRTIDLRSTDDLRLLVSYQVRRSIAGLTVSDGYVAYAERDTATINLIEIATGREWVSVVVHGNPTGIAWDGTRIWYCDYTTLQLRAIEVPGMAVD
jgi:hypothetical protein